MKWPFRSINWAGALGLLFSLAQTIELKAEDASFKEGCWVNLYDQKMFSGHKIHIKGPQEQATLDLIHLNKKWRGLKSIEVGPNANVILFGEKNFQDPDFVLSAGVSAPSIARMPKRDEIESAKVLCVDRVDRRDSLDEESLIESSDSDVTVEVLPLVDVPQTLNQ